jgi:hypothetical protein
LSAVELVAKGPEAVLIGSRSEFVSLVISSKLFEELNVESFSFT